MSEVKHSTPVRIIISKLDGDLGGCKFYCTVNISALKNTTFWMEGKNVTEVSV